MYENMSDPKASVAFQTQESTSSMAQNSNGFQIPNFSNIQNEPQSKKLKLHQDHEEIDFFIPNQEDTPSILSSSSATGIISSDSSSAKRKQPKSNSSNVSKPIHNCAFCDFVTVTQKSFEEHHRENHKSEDVNKQTKILSQVSKFPP